MIKLVNKATKSLNPLVFLHVLFGFAKCYADINLILLPPLSLLAEQTYGWQICLIRKLLALTSFPAPAIVFSVTRRSRSDESH